MTDEELQVVVSAVTANFQKPMKDAHQTLVDFGTQGTKTFTKIADSEKAWTSRLQQGHVKKELKQIAGELGGMAGAGGIASRAMGGLLSVISGGGGLLAGVGLLATAVAFLTDQEKKAAEEAKRSAEEHRQMAEAFETATAAGAELTEAQIRLMTVTGQLREGDRASEIRTLEKEQARLQERYDSMNAVLHDSGTFVENLRFQNADLNKNFQTTSYELAKVTADLERTRSGYKDLTEALKEAGEEAAFWQKQEDGLAKGAVAERERRNKAFDESTARHNRSVEASLKREQKEIEAFHKATAPLQKNFAALLQGGVENIKNAKELWHSFSQSFVKDATAMLANAAVKKLFDAIGKGLFGVGEDNNSGGKGKGLLGGLIGSIPVVGSLLKGVLGFAEGGSVVTNGPTLFMAGEGRNKRERVDVSPMGQSAAGGGLVVNIIHQGSGPTSHSAAYSLGLSEAAGLAHGIAKLDLRLGVRR